MIPEVSAELLTSVHNGVAGEVGFDEVLGKTISSAETPTTKGRIVTRSFLFIMMG